MGSRTPWLWLFVGSLAVTAVLGVMAILLPSIPFEGELLITSALLTGYSLLGLMASVAIARGRLVRLAWVSICLLALSLLDWLVLVWFDSAISWEAEEAIAKPGATMTTFGIVTLHAALLCQLNLDRRVSQWVRIGTIAAATIAAALLVSVFWDVFVFGEDWTARLIGALAIPAALGTIAVPVLARIEYVSRRDGEEHTIGRHVSVSMRCPRCSHEREQVANRRGRCEECGLEITVSFAEPRCLCGYLLHGLPEPICPECGRAVEDDKWWRTEPHDSDCRDEHQKPL